MAVAGVPAASAVTSRLDYLLRRARAVKQSTSIDPSLAVSELVPESEALLGDIEGEKEVRALAVESAARSVFYANLVCLPCPNSSLLLTSVGINSNRRGGVRDRLEFARHSAVLWRPRYGAL